MELPSARKRLLCQLSRSEEHTSELQSQSNLVCRLLLEKKKNTIVSIHLLMNYDKSSPATRWLNDAVQNMASFTIVCEMNGLHVLVCRRSLTYVSPLSLH